jgi:hypothetical protein
VKLEYREYREKLGYRGKRGYREFRVKLEYRE